MRRREFIAGLAGAVAWPVSGRAQQPIPVIGFLRSSPLAESAHLTTAFRQGLKEAGFVDGHNIAIEYRSAENVEGRLPTLVGNLLRVPVAVIIGESLSAFVGKVARATVRRQRSLDRTDGLNKGEFLAHRNVHRSEDETALAVGPYGEHER